MFNSSAVFSSKFTLIITIKINIDAAGIKVVGVFRSEESAKKVLARLGNPAEDKFVSIIGNVGKF